MFVLLAGVLFCGCKGGYDLAGHAFANNNDDTFSYYFKNDTECRYTYNTPIASGTKMYTYTIEESTLTIYNENGSKWHEATIEDDGKTLKFTKSFPDGESNPHDFIKYLYRDDA